MMIQRKSFIALAITAALAAPAAVAQTGIPPEKQPAVGSEGTSKAPAPEGARNPIDRTADTGAMTFRSLDANKDGFVSRDEAKNSSELNRQFGSLDKDGDGKLSPQELGSFQAGSMGQDRVGASGSSGVGSSTEPSGGTRASGNRPPETPKKSY